MAKMKTFAVDIEVTTTHTVFIEARRPNGAVEKLQTEEGWREATRYDYDHELPQYFEKKSINILKVRDI